MATTKIRKNKSKTLKKRNRKSLKIGGNDDEIRDEIKEYETDAQNRKNIMDYFVYYFVFGKDFLLEYIKYKVYKEPTDVPSASLRSKLWKKLFSSSTESLKQKIYNIQDSENISDHTYSEARIKRFLKFHIQPQFINILSLCLFYFVNFDYDQWEKCPFYKYIIEVYIVGNNALHFISTNPFETQDETQDLMKKGYLSIFDLVESIPREERQEQEQQKHKMEILYQYSVLDVDDNDGQLLKGQLNDMYLKYLDKMERLEPMKMKPEIFNFFYTKALKLLKDIVEKGIDITPEQLKPQEREYITQDSIITTKNDETYQQARKTLYGDIEYKPYSQWLDKHKTNFERNRKMVDKARRFTLRNFGFSSR